MEKKTVEDRGGEDLVAGQDLGPVTDALVVVTTPGAPRGCGPPAGLGWQNSDLNDAGAAAPSGYAGCPERSGGCCRRRSAAARLHNAE